jgi:thioredoxin reductase (NADPH)
MAKEKYQVIIIGSGPAGYTAAIYTARAELKTLVLAGPMLGGQLTTTTEVENFPGFPGGISGPELVTKMNEQVVGLGVVVVNQRAIKIEKRAAKDFVVFTNEGEYQSEAVIVAAGAAARWLGLPSEQKTSRQGRLGLRYLRWLFLS